MKLRVVDRPWEHVDRRIAVEEQQGVFWVLLGEFGDRGSAEEFAQLYAKGPRVLLEISRSIPEGIGRE